MIVLAASAFRAKPSGVKSFLIQYRNRNGRSRRLSIGQVGKMTLDQARKAAMKALGEVADGKDPAEERQMARRGESIDQLCDLYMKDHCANRCKESTIAAHEWLMRRFIRPKLGNRKLLELRPADVAKLHADLQDTPYNANRVLGLLRAMLNCAERWEMIPRGANPAAHIKPFPEKKRERYLSQEELDTLMTILADGEAEGSIDSLHRRCSPAPDLHRLPAWRDPDLGMGERRSGQRQTRLREAQDRPTRRQDHPPQRTGPRTIGQPAARGWQSLRHRW